MTDAQEAQVSEDLRAALEPFAQAAELFNNRADSAGVTISMANLRRARDAYNKAQVHAVTDTYPHVQAAFINAIAEEGTKAEAVQWLQKQWNETCALRAENERLRARAVDMIARLLCWNNGIAECVDLCKSYEGCAHGMRDFGEEARVVLAPVSSRDSGNR